MHGVPADCEPCARIVGDQALFNSHLRKRQASIFFAQRVALLAQQRTLGPACPFNLPQCVAPVSYIVNAIQRADPRQQRQFSAVELGHALRKIAG